MAAIAEVAGSMLQEMETGADAAATTARMEGPAKGGDGGGNSRGGPAEGCDEGGSNSRGGKKHVTKVGDGGGSNS